MYPVGLEFLNIKNHQGFVIRISFGYFFPQYEYTSLHQDFKTISSVQLQNIVSSISDSTIG